MREVKKASSEDEKQLVREQVGFREICRRLDQFLLLGKDKKFSCKEIVLSNLLVNP